MKYSYLDYKTCTQNILTLDFLENKNSDLLSDNLNKSMLPFEDLFDVDYVTILATEDVAAS
jgi:hypothetical protein